MQIEFNIDQLKKNKIYLATPMYGGLATGVYTQSCLHLQKLCTKNDIEIYFEYLFNESLISRARNFLVAQFLKTDCTHMMFIDSDIRFNPEDVIALLSLDKEIIGAPYPVKLINWDNIKNGAIKNTAATNLKQLEGSFVFNPIHTNTEFDINELLEVRETGTGFMMIKREVFSKMAEAYPNIVYRSDSRMDNFYDNKMHAFFDTSIEDGRYLSEDYTFCHRWRNIGGQVYICPWMKLDHVGYYSFTGDIKAIAKNT